MILNETAISKLAERSVEDEAGSSSHWLEKSKGVQFSQGEVSNVIGADGYTPRKTLVHQLGHYGLLAPFRRMGHGFANFKEFQRIGRELALRRDSQFDQGLIRQVLTLSLISEYLRLDQMRLPIVVIGDGWGAMASLILSCLPQAKVVSVNLSRMLLADLVYIRKSSPDADICVANDEDEYLSSLANDSVRVIGVCADDSQIIGQGEIGLAINIVSMQEMDPPVIASYFESLRRSSNPKTLFYCCNRIYKTLPDGTVVRFEDYPWVPEDTVLLDEMCQWHQYYYQLRPPFYRRYTGRIKHRLAWISKG